MLRMGRSWADLNESFQRLEDGLRRYRDQAGELEGKLAAAKLEKDEWRNRAEGLEQENHRLRLGSGASAGEATEDY